MAAQSVGRPTVAAITVSYDSGEVLPTLLESLAGASRETVQVIVVDNLPGTGSDAIAESAGAEYLALPHNPGYGGAVNAGARLVAESVEWILIVNPDVRMERGAIDELLSVVHDEPTVGSVGPEIVTLDGSTYPSARRIPSLRTGVGHALFANAWPHNPWSRRYREDGQRVARDAGWLSGACVLVRRRAFDEIGRFDESYFMYFEDVDLGMRLTQSGWRNRYEPSVTVSHVGAHSTQSRRREMIRAHHASATRFLAKKYPGPLWLPVRIILRVGLNARSALTQLRGLD